MITSPSEAPELIAAIMRTERHCADRRELPFAMLLVRTARPCREDVAQGLTEAVVATTRVGDVVGWIEHRRLLAVIIPGIAGAGASEVAHAIAARIRVELGRRLPPEALASVALAVHVYQPGSEPLEHQPSLARLLRKRHARSCARRWLDDVLKRALDVAGSAALLAALAPLLAVVAVLVRLTSPGPVLFRQDRVGQRMRPFTMLKFRTMRAGVDHDIHRAFVTQFIVGGGGDRPRGQGAIFKLTNDPRVTRLGRLLRRTSIDELPQLWNVLRGEMSLVGPRPALAYEVEHYRPWHRRRLLDIKPGITGAWQLSGRSRTTFDDMVRLDLRYARTRSLWTDIKVLLATPAAALSGRGAV